MTSVPKNIAPVLVIKAYVSRSLKPLRLEENPTISNTLNLFKCIPWLGSGVRSCGAQSASLSEFSAKYQPMVNGKHSDHVYWQEVLGDDRGAKKAKRQAGRA